jgi:hypothetical protein
MTEMEEKKDTSPVFGRAPRHKKIVTIKQENEFAPSLDVTAVYPSDELPEWFAPLQSIVEDEGFSSGGQIVITLGSDDGTGGSVKYYITAVRVEEKTIEPEQARPGDIIEYRDWPSGVGRMPFARWHPGTGGERILLGLSEKTGLEISVQSHRLIRIIRSK